MQIANAQTGPFGGGDGYSEATAYELYETEHLVALADSVYNTPNWSVGKYFKVTNNIPDSVRSVITNFNGIFDGQDYTITLAISETKVSLGLFGTTLNAVIKNVIVNGYVSGTFSVAGIVGVAYTNTSITNCINLADITGFQYTGGIVGNSLQTTITNCINVGNINGKHNAGGIAGESFNNEITQCMNLGSVSGDSYVGGITGTVYTNTSITNCINCGFVKGNIDNIGGIAGHFQDGIVENCINTGVVEGPEGYTGAIIGACATYIGLLALGCFYNKQMCIYGGIAGEDIEGQAEGRLTKELIGTNLQAILGDENWIYNDNLYPILKELKDEIASKVAVSPAYLDDINADYDIYNNIDECFYVNLENGVQWAKAFDNINFSNSGKVYLEKIGEDTIYASIGEYKKTIPIMINNLCQNNMKFTICADTHKLVHPNAINYSLPIHIIANEDVSGYVIEKLVLEIDRNIFYTQNIDNDANWNNLNGIITINNISIPSLKSDIKTELLTVRGDILLGDKDSSTIDIKEVIFIEELSEAPKLFNGYITLNICKEGNDRLLKTFDYAPSLIISKNPASDLLEVKCKVIENGAYWLEIVDITGKTKIVKEWSVNINDKQEFNFTIPISMYGNSSYFLILNTPSAKYSHKFIVEK